MAPLLPTIRRAARTWRTALGPEFEPCAVGYAEGRVLAAAGLLEEALARWLQALDEPTARGWPCLMNALVAVGRTLGRERALAAEMAARSGRLEELVLWQGHLLRLAGSPKEALAPLCEAERRLPGTLRYTATTERLRALLALDRTQEALAVCDLALRRQPGFTPGLTVSRAGILAAQGHLQQALSLLDTVIARHPDLPEAHLNRGGALMRLGRRQEALAALQAATRLAPHLAAEARNIRERAP